MTDSARRLTVEALQQLVISTEPWLSCEDCFVLLDGYVEARLADPSTTAPAMDVHLAACSACAEEARSLTVLVAHDDNIDPEPVLRHLRSNSSER
jgi:hypothetical protein